MDSVLPVKELLEQRRVVFGFIYALTRDIDAAEEVFQDVSVTVLQEASRGSEVVQFLPWVLGIARNRVSDFYRKRARSRPVPEVLEEAILGVFQDNGETRDETARKIRGLLDCVDELPPRQKEILQVRYRDRKPVAGVAAAVGWKPEAVKVALSKIRKALLDCLRRKDLIEGVDAL
jgi:RNA polymerase sigma-70 factor, ECF subfamily